jgi:hypothetical protein
LNPGRRASWSVRSSNRIGSDEWYRWWYQVSSAWLKKQFPQSDVLVLRDNLSPMIPPVILPGIEAEA